MDKYTGNLSEDMFYNLKNDFDKKISRNKSDIEFVENKLGFMKNNEENENKYKKIIERYTSFEQLTNEMVFDFIDYVEVCEKDENRHQNVIIHWRF